MVKTYYIKNYDLISKDNSLNDYLNQNNIKYLLNKKTYVLELDEKEEIINDVYHKIQMFLNMINSDIVMEEFNPNDSYKKVLILNNLDCPNCAMKVEELAKKELGEESITVDFATSRFIIETKDFSLYTNIIEKVTRVAKIIDKKIEVIDVVDNKKKKDQEEKTINKYVFAIGLALYLSLIILHYIVFNILFKSEGYVLDNINNNVPYLKWPLICIAICAYLLLGGDVLLTALNNMRHGRFFDEKFLMSLATIVAFAIHSYIEAISVMLFYKIGEILQERVVRSSRKSISQLMDIKPSIAKILIDDKEIEIDPTQLTIGDVIVVRPGERIPADGIVQSGEANLDTSAITGESKYYEVGYGSKIMSGSINLDGVLLIEVRKKYSESLVSKILDLVENANTNKAKSEKFVTKFAKYYTPIVCILAFVIAMLYLFLSDRNIHDSIYPAMVFLVVSCPCALIISVPLGYFGAIGGASKRGILIKGSNFLDEFNNVGIVAFDKTGTLTKGQFVVDKIVSINDKYTSNDILRIAANCECLSNHPIAKSIVNKFGIENVTPNEVKTLENNKRGMRIVYDDCSYLIGNESYFKEKEIQFDAPCSDGIIVYVASKDGVIGYVELVDEIRDECIETIRKLKSSGIDVAMLTGDNERVANRVAQELGIEKFYSGLTPIEKVKRIRKLKKEYPGKRLVFIGDGVNDAPVILNSDIGIAMGKLGTDAAIEVSDIVLMNDDLTKLTDIFRIAKKVKTIVMENIIFALAVKLIVLIIAAVSDSGNIHMWEGVFADVGVSLIATINSLRVSSIDKKQFIKNLKIHRKNENRGEKCF